MIFKGGKMKEIKINTDYIKLDQFLKLCNIVQTGGHAKLLIQDGQVKVNDEIAFERGKKLRIDDIVEVIDYDKYIIK